MTIYHRELEFLLKKKKAEQMPLPKLISLSSFAISVSIFITVLPVHRGTFLLPLFTSHVFSHHVQVQGATV